MGTLSENFNKKDFVCRCTHCKEAFRISLTLVGVLELIREHFKRRVTVVNGYRCAECNEELGGIRKSYHARGKAVDITVADVPLEEVFLFAETLPEVRGLGFYPLKKFVHLDVREPEYALKWVVEQGDHVELTDEKRRQYNLLPKEGAEKG